MLLNNIENAKQIIDFSGLNLGGNKYPTDIDAFLDIGGELFIFIELKYKNSPMKRGQELAFARLCDICNKGGATAIYLVAEHETESEFPIDIAEAIVTKFRTGSKMWKPPYAVRTVREAVLEIISWHENKVN
jgi:hypothetical protein